MNRRLNIFLLSLLIFVFLIVTIVLFCVGIDTFSIVFMAVAVILSITLYIYINNTRDGEEQYVINLKNILKTYDAVLVESEELPLLKGKNVIKTFSMEDLIDAQTELRKPIYFVNHSKSCDFILVDSEVAVVYILKENESVVSPLEITIKQLETDIKNREQYEIEKIFDNIVEPTIVKLPNNKSYKVSLIAVENKK